MSKLKNWDKRVKRMDLHDVQLTKISVVAFTLFVLALWPWLLGQVLKVHWSIYFVIWILAALRPAVRVFRR